MCINKYLNIPHLAHRAKMNLKLSMQYWEIDTERKKTKVATDFEVNG